MSKVVKVFLCGMGEGDLVDLNKLSTDILNSYWTQVILKSICARKPILKWRKTYALLC